ncbi:hypothetical protein Glove_69g70 [Diversispora epigaea]|uniref:Crinkler effector protein N-terminal domain-containing protein n=1 Tax=Diversispora epigaea TaxID=1348612 RepID=A0A397JA33_9GLOM|nr:hypothetical protein Glove_69g70 [Diversispora epigaea]
MSSNIKLNCLIYGDSKDHIFQVHLEKINSVYDLKNIIKKSKPILFANTDANDIMLWEVNIPIRNGTMEVDIVLENNEQTGIQKLLYPDEEISNLFTGNMNNTIRIVVERPSEFPNKRVKFEDKSLIDLWKALKNIKIDKSEEFLQLPGDVSFFETMNILYIRKCYRDLLEIVFDENIRKLRVTGNPGIGKTFFAYYLLYILAKREEIIIYNSCVNQCPIAFDKEKAFRVYETDVLDSYLCDKSVWYIVDGKEPKSVKAKTILLCSPRKDHYKNFDKYVGTTIRYMPVWSPEEIEACRVRIFDRLDKAKVEDLFSKWGGIPRFILEKAQDSIQQLLLEEAIVKNSNPKIFNFVGEIDHADDISHRLIHIHTNTYTDKIIRFASEYVAEKVTYQLEKDYRRELINFVTASSLINEYSALRGFIFENIAHRILQMGGRFNIRLLKSDLTNSTTDISEHTELTCNKYTKLIFNNISEIKEGMYCQPKQKNFASVDAIIAPDTLFQMTVSNNHPININGLKNLINKLGGESGTNPINFYFVLPKGLYENFQIQKLHKNNAKVMPTWITERFRQYALEIDLSSCSW